MNMRSIFFSEEHKEDIIKLYKNGFSTTKIGEKYGISKNPIIKLLKKDKLIKEKKSSKKIELSDEQKKIIQELYLNQNKNSYEISKIVNLTPFYIDKFLSKCGYRRNKSEANRIYRTGKKLPQKIKENMSKAQKKLSMSGNRVQNGGICKFFNINGISCQGTFEKFFIEYLIKSNKELPNNAESITTPYGVYYPDFQFEDYLVEIKSDYTFDILLGNRINRFNKKIDTNQYNKIKWVNDNLKEVKIFVVDKIKNKIIEKNI